MIGKRLCVSSLLSRTISHNNHKVYTKLSIDMLWKNSIEIVLTREVKYNSSQSFVICIIKNTWCLATSETVGALVNAQCSKERNTHYLFMFMDWNTIELVVKILYYRQLEGQHNCSLELFPNWSIDRKQEREWRMFAHSELNSMCASAIFSQSGKNSLP